MPAVDIAFSCYPVSSLKKAREFYEKVLMLKATSVWVKDDRNGMIEYTIGPGTLAIGAGADSFKLGPGGAAIAIEVTGIGKMVEELKRKKVNFVVELMDTPVCRMAVILDPDGNRIMLHERKPR